MTEEAILISSNFQKQNVILYLRYLRSILGVEYPQRNQNYDDNQWVGFAPFIRLQNHHYSFALIKYNWISSFPESFSTKRGLCYILLT